MAADETLLCQKCRKTLVPDTSLADVDVRTLADRSILQPGFFANGMLPEELEANGRRAMSTSSTSSFVDVEVERRGSNVMQTLRLCEIASVVTELDHPLCVECTQQLLANLEDDLSKAEFERNQYADILSRLTSSQQAPLPEGDFQKEMSTLEETEKTLLKQLQDAEAEKAAVDREAAALTADEAELRNLEERYWQDVNEFQLRVKEFHEQRASVDRRGAYMADQLEKLKRTNVYNDTFHIWYEGHFGTINNLRLGKLPSQPVEWSEINAAWGQAALLLYTIAQRCNHEFKQYQIIPYGSFSRMEKKQKDKSSLDLFGSDSVTFGFMFGNRSFDKGMVAFLECIKEFGDLAENRDANFKLPYRINDDKINEISIKMQFNQDESWTKALKYMLTNLKWLLAWVCKNM